MSQNATPEELDIRSEEDLRILVSQYLREVGFDKDEFKFEKYFSIRLGHTQVDIEPDRSFNERLGGRSDILITRNGQSLAILELKNPSHTLNEDDARQAISYARLLDQIAPIAILTNGLDTKVYDVFQSGLIEITNLEDSSWGKKGKSYSGFAEELKFEAARILIGVNHQTLELFCEKQVANSLSDLKSNVPANRKYIPNVYVERRRLSESFESWTNSTSPIFALIAPSGYGKTNFMCAVADNLTASAYSLFYSAGRIRNDILSELVDEFSWEFHRQKDIVHIFDRLDSISRDTGRVIRIFIDGLDEYRHGLKALRNELLAISKEISNYPNIRLIISCKTYDWSYLIIDDGQSFNSLAETITPHCIASERQSEPSAARIGFHLEEFTDEELEEAIQKYSEGYEIIGTFTGDLKMECHNPLLLRFVAEVFGGRKEELPVDITSKELFALYYKRKIANIKHPDIARRLLTRISAMVFESGKRIVSRDDLILGFDWGHAEENTLETLARLGVLHGSQDPDGLSYVGFEFYKFLLYFYLFHVLKLHRKGLQNQIQEINILRKMDLGIEAIGLYLIVEDNDEIGSLLLGLMQNDLRFTAQLLTSLESVMSYRRIPVPIEHIENYLGFYNVVRSELFSCHLATIMPYSENSLGGIFIADSSFRFRGCTKAYPDPHVLVEDPDLIKALVRGPTTTGLQRDLDPVGLTYLGGNHSFAEFPQKAALEHLIHELSEILGNRLLDESECFDLHRERVYDLLTRNPSIWLKGDDLPHKRYWELLGFDSLEDFSNAQIDDLINRTTKMIAEFVKTAQAKPEIKHSYEMRLRDLYCVLFSLSQMDRNGTLGPQDFSIESLFTILDHETLNFRSDDLTSFVPRVLELYRKMFADNFPELLPFAPLYNNVSKCSLIEVTHPEFPFGTDFLTISYISFPSGKEGEPIIVGAKYEHSRSRDLCFDGLYGRGYSRSADQGLGFIRLNETIAEREFREDRAWVVKTTFPSTTPLTDQVYQIITLELQHLFNSNGAGWGDIPRYSNLSGRYSEEAIRKLVNSDIVRNS